LGIGHEERSAKNCQYPMDGRMKTLAYRSAPHVVTGEPSRETSETLNYAPEKDRLIAVTKQRF